MKRLADFGDIAPALRELVDAGRAQSLEGLDHDRFDWKGFTRALAFEICDCVASRQIDLRSLPPIVVALVLAENASWFYFGSVTRIPWVTGYLPDDVLEWTYANAKNPYIPFGSAGRCRREAATIADYLRCQEAIRRMREVQQALVDLRRKMRLRIAAARHRARMEEQAERSRQRLDLLACVANLEPLERLALIARDLEVPPWYYHERWAQIPPEQLGALDAAERDSLIRRLGGAPRGAWRALRRVLERLPAAQSGSRGDPSAGGRVDLP